MGLVPVSPQPAVSGASRKMPWERSSRSASLWFTLYAVGLYSGNSSLGTRGRLECVGTASGEREKRAQKLLSSQGGCGSLWLLVSPGNLKL